MSGEKTEAATPKRLREARKKGQVAKSKELMSAAAMIGLFMFSIWGVPRAVVLLGNLIALPAKLMDLPMEEALPVLLHECFTVLAIITLPVLAVVVVLTVAGHLVVSGFLITTHPLKPDLNHLNPASNIKRVVSVDNLMEFVFSIIKVGLLGVIFWQVIVGSLDALCSSTYLSLPGAVGVVGAVMKHLWVWCGVSFAIVAVADLAFRKWRHAQQMRMSRQEVMDEFKEVEGDPLIKGARRQLYAELLAGGGDERIRRARCVITDQSGSVAVAIHFQEDEGQLPRVAAKAESQGARTVLDAADEAGVAVVVNEQLAHALNSSAMLDEPVPAALIGRVAAVLPKQRPQ